MNSSFKCTKSSTVPCKEIVFSGGLWKTLWLFQGQIRFSKYACCVMEKFASSRREGWFFSLVGLQYLLKLPTTHARTADGSRGSASGLACFIIPYMLQGSSCSIFRLSSAWKLPLHRCRNYMQLFASSIVFFLVSLHFSSLWMSDKTEKVLFFNTGGRKFHEILIISWHLAICLRCIILQNYSITEYTFLI